MILPGVKGDYRQQLDAALAKDSINHRNVSLIQFAVGQARKDNSVLNCILRKVLPDLKSIDAKIIGDSPFKLIIDCTPRTKPASTSPHGDTDTQGDSYVDSDIHKESDVTSDKQVTVTKRKKRKKSRK